MRKLQPAILFLSFAVISLNARAAQPTQPAESEAERSAVQAVINLGKQFEKTTLDCSHFVNYLFDQSGLEYDYAPSIVLYRGTEAFRRVYHPTAGDLIVWRGHVGIVVDPQAKTFISALRRGVRISSYVSSYWRRRGTPRFLRYKLPPQNEWAWQTRNGPVARGVGDAGLN